MIMKNEFKKKHECEKKIKNKYIREKLVKGKHELEKQQTNIFKLSIEKSYLQHPTL